MGGLVQAMLSIDLFGFVADVFGLVFSIIKGIVGVIAFLLYHWYIIVGIILALVALYFLTGLTDGPGILTLIASIIHMLVLWNISPEEGRLWLVIVRCVFPAIIAILATLILLDHPIAGYVCAAIVYIGMYILAIKYSNVLIPIAAGVVILPVTGLITYLFGIGGTARMDMESGSAFGDSEVVQNLYNKGVSPSGRYGSAQQRQKANQNLLQHGVNPFDDD